MSLSYFLHHVARVDSTNTYAREHWHALADRTCVHCDVQDAGKGRYGRTWLSDKDGTLAMSFVLKREGHAGALLSTWTALTLYAAVVLCRVLHDYGVVARIKWPNDVLVDGKKIAGILAESVVLSAHSAKDSHEIFDGVVVGIGINVNLSEASVQGIAALGGREATSLRHCTASVIDRAMLFERYVECFFEKYDAFMQDGFPYIYNEYNELSYSLHQSVCINTASDRLTGTLKAFTLQGELILVDPFGAEHVFNSGELL